MKRLVILLALILTNAVFAADAVVKEETTLPAPAEAITPTQLPPLLTGAKALQKPAAPQAEPKKSAENNRTDENLMGQDEIVG